MLVKKHNGKWRDLDSFPLPCFDLIVDSTTKHHILNFMDAYLGYNQIKMNPDNKEKISFIIDHRLFYYQVMLFKL